MRGSYLRRRIDFLLGIPCVILTRCIRGHRVCPQSIQTIGIFSCSAIGDSIIASAIARDLKAAFPGARIIAILPPSAAGLSGIVEGFDQEVILRVTEPLEALRIIRGVVIDVLIDVTPWPRMTAWLVACSGAKFTIGFRTPGQHRHYAYDAAVPHRADRHEVDNMRALLAPLGVVGGLRPVASKPLRNAPPDHDRAGGRMVVFHPWASGFRSTMREWALECWAALGQRLIAEGACILITGASSDRTQATVLAGMIGHPEHVHVLAGQLDLFATARQMTAADTVVTVNTGTMHLAAALDIKTVALHGPTNPMRWGPLSRAAVVVGPSAAQGGAYLHLGFEYARRAANCMTRIAVDDVMDALQLLTEENDLKRDETRFATLRLRGPHGMIGSAADTFAPPSHAAPSSWREGGGLRTKIKRAEDIVGAVLLLLLTAPVMVLIALLIKLESPGPVFFRQQRFGLQGRTFQIIKFRTMRVDVQDQDCRQQVTQGDKRLTRGGALIRRHSLDELPQLINVLRGEMSIVGPRPHAVLTSVDNVLLADLSDTYVARHNIKPGITGWAQVNGWRGPIDSIEKLKKRVDHDLFYAANWSLLLDLKIMLRTAAVAWHDDAAY